MKKNKFSKITILIILILVLVLGLSNCKHRASGAPTSTISVQVARVKQVALSSEISALGTLSAKSVEITPEISGHIQKIFFQDGQFAQENSPIIQLNDAIYESKKTSANAQLQFSQANYHRMVLLGKEGAIAKEAIEQAQADLQQKKADAEEAAVMVNKMQLTAPFAGTLGKSKVNLGDYITVGQSVVTLTDTKNLRVEYNVPEKFLPLIKLGQAVKITATPYPDKLFSGQITFISPVINLDNRSLSLYANIDNSAGLLAPGMLVNVIQSLGKAENKLMIPARSLVPTIDGQQVYRVIGNKAVATNVVIGKRTIDTVEIKQGLNLNDMIVTDGQIKIKNGSLIEFKE